MKKIFTLLFVCSSLISSAKTIWVIDSEINYTWSGQDWNYGWKSTYEYDSIGNKVNQLTYNWINNHWEYTYKSTYECDKNGKEIQSISYSKSGDDWVVNAKSNYEYDSDGNQTQEVIYNWRNNSWVKSLKYVYKYDNNGNKTDRLCYSWNNDWILYMENKYEYEYDDNGRITQQISYKGGGKNQKTIFEYKCLTVEDNNNTNNEEEFGGENQGGNNTSPATEVSESVTNAVNICIFDNRIVVENATDEIRVYDAMGRIVGRDVARNVSTIKINNSGVYIVKTGSVVKRVVVN